ALLAATLKTYQRSGCDSEQLSLSCPRGTSISIQLAQYGRAGDLTDHSLCPPVSQDNLSTTGRIADVIHYSEVKPPTICTVSRLQYTLLQTVVNACQKKRHCKFAASLTTHSSADPCASIRKFVEIAYKCRPFEFRSKETCENDNMILTCNPYSRIAIYRASFGYTEGESVQCERGTSTNTEKMTTSDKDKSISYCLASYASDTVMKICHGRRRCSVIADASTFGRPCKADVQMYLKVVYTCSKYGNHITYNTNKSIYFYVVLVPHKVLKDRYKTASDIDEPQQTDLDQNQDEIYNENQFYRESDPFSSAQNLQGAIPNVGLSYGFVDGSERGYSTTHLSPIIEQNVGSLGDILLSSRKFLSRIRASIENELVTENSTSALLNETIIPTAQIENITESPHSDENLFNRRKCEDVDGWGEFDLNCTNNYMVTERLEMLGFLVNWVHTYMHIRKHQEKFYLYLILSVATGVLLILTLMFANFTIKKRRANKNNCSNVSNCKQRIHDVHADINDGENGRASKFKLKPSRKTHRENPLKGDISEITADISLT
ncbi:hypothetical protein KR038_006092, partial [Drosophila bunnanda]